METGFLTLGQTKLSLNSSYLWVYSSDIFPNPIILIGLPRQSGDAMMIKDKWYMIKGGGRIWHSTHKFIMQCLYINNDEIQVWRNFRPVFIEYIEDVGELILLILL